MKKNIVVKDNALINASYNLSLVAQRLVLLAIVNARETGKGVTADDPLHIHVESYTNQFDVRRNSAYQALKDACDDLFSRQFSYQTKTKKGNITHHRSRWVSEIAYTESEATVSLIFAPAVVPLITRLEQHFTSYELDQVSKLSTAYAVRLYELLASWRSVGKTPIISVSDLRERLGVSATEYKLMADFKKRVLDPALKQVTENSDLTVVKCEQHKKGRSIGGFSFNLKQKRVNKPVARDPDTVDLFVKMTDAQRSLFASKLAQLPEMGEYARVGEETHAFSMRIADMLLVEENFKKFHPLLEKVGFKLRKTP